MPKQREKGIMNKIYFIIIMYFLLVGGILQAQTSIDSIVNEARSSSNDTTFIDGMYNAIWKLNRSNPSQALELIKEVENRFETSEVEYKRNTVIYYKGVMYKNMGDFETAEQYLREYLEKSKIKGYKRGVYGGYTALANMYTNMHYYSKALEIYQENYDFAVSEKDSSGIARILTRIGFLHSQNENFDKALEYNKEAVEILEEKGQPVDYANAINDRGIIFEKMEPNQLKISNFK